MSRSFYTLDRKEFTCYGPKSSHKISEGFKAEAEIGELYGRYWTAFIRCANESREGRCSGAQTGGRCNCPYSKMSETELRTTFFPNARTGGLTLRE